ncbi:MAG TPA: hypothetical protein VJH92_01465 [Candidatus Nanoarchaeia archaeon]|nr:hypothetical protein [Candidatus Nanoarchaeia archaeon]
MKRLGVILLFLLVSSVFLISASVYIPESCSSSEIRQAWDSIFKESSSNLNILTNNQTVSNTCGRFFVYKLSGSNISYIDAGIFDLFGVKIKYIGANKIGAKQEFIDLIESFDNVSDANVLSDVSFNLSTDLNSTNSSYEGINIMGNYTTLRTNAVNSSQLNSEFSSIYEEIPGNWTTIEVYPGLSNDSLYIFSSEINLTNSETSVTALITLKKDYASVSYLTLTIPPNESTSNFQKQAETKINQTAIKINNLKNQSKTYSQFYEQAIEKAIGLTEIERKFSIIKQEYNNADSDSKYRNITLKLSNLNVPDLITTSKTAKSIVFIPKRDYMDPELLTTITNENYSSSKESEYKEAILGWNLNNLDTKYDFTEISIVRNNSETPILRFYNLKIIEKQTVLGDFYLIMPELEDLKFSKNYGEKKISDKNYILLDQGNRNIEFFTTEDIIFSDLPLMIAPRISELGISPDVGEGGRNKISKWWIFAIIIFILFLIWLVVYMILHRWYKNEYEDYLFRNRTHLYNLLNYIHNSKKKGMSDREITQSLKNVGWDGEQLGYAIKKYTGKRIGMFDLGWIFSKKLDPNIPPSPPKGLLPRDRTSIPRKQ